MYSKLHFIYLLMFVLHSEQQLKDHGIKSMGWKVHCKLQPNSYHCSNRTVEYSFYYDILLQGCKTFVWHDCDLTFNRFSTLSHCATACYQTKFMTDADMYALSWDVTCRLQFDFGRCFDYNPMFYYDVSARKCLSFSYSGCGGNNNRFLSYRECMSVCEPVVSGKPKVLAMSEEDKI